jgi:LmbE family N-acetylglucosaminyl deacetylase
MADAAETVLHLAPHPDDEVIGAPATLLALSDAGRRVVNLACGLGSDPGAREVRRAELEEACARARFGLRVADGDDVEAAIAAALIAESPALVISPDPGDRHPAHKAVGRAAERLVRCRWWTWAVWRDLAEPTLLVPFGEERLEEVLHVLAAHRSQLGRNDFATLVRARAEVAKVRGPELVFGFGSSGIAEPYAELLTERVRGSDASWRTQSPRALSL